MSVGIVIVNWNGKGLTLQFLDSIREHTEYEDYEVIVFDNDSNDGSVEAVRSEFPEATVIEYDENIGFVGGENEGILRTDHDYYFLANNDCIVHSTGWLARLVETMESDSDIGIVGPDNEPDPTVFHGAAYWDGTTVNYGPDEPRSPKEVDIVSGAQFLIDSDVFERIGLIDETFWPAFNEEIDFCYRAQQAGFRIIFEPRVLVEHLEGKTVDQDLDKYEINRKYGIRFRWLNFPPARILRGFPSAARRFGNAVFHRDKGLDVTLRDDWKERLIRDVRAHWWNVKNLPDVIEGRSVRKDVLKSGDPHTHYWTSHRQTGD